MSRSALPMLCAVLALACAAAAKRPEPVAPVEGPAEPPQSELEEPAPVLVALPIVKPGVYRLKLSADCGDSERVVTGLLTLEQIGANDMPPKLAGTEPGRLLWGHMDVDLRSLSGCLGATSRSTDEPIHPNVLVEVLKWEGEPRRQVLLVSADVKKSKGAKSHRGGIAMWVESAEDGRMTGVWSRWEVIDGGDGRWEAELKGDTPSDGATPATRTGSRSTSKD